MRTKLPNIVTAFLLCFASLTAFGQSADNPETVKYSIGSYAPIGDFGAYLEEVEIGLYLVAGTAPGKTVYDKVNLDVKLWKDAIKKYRYNGKSAVRVSGFVSVR